jgi:hypothetical protein
MAKIKKLVQTVNKFTINDTTKIHCDDISAVVSGANGNTITITATFPTNYNGLKAVFLSKIPADPTSSTVPSLSGYNVIGSALISGGTAQLVITVNEWSNMSVVAYVVPLNNGVTGAGTADLA